MNKSEDPAVVRAARRLYAQSAQGVLSTLSVDLSGYPFGSVVTFATDRAGRPVLFISDLAQHTRNIGADPRVSLTLLEPGEDLQASGRLTLVSDVERVPAEELPAVSQRYLRRFPQAAEYRRAHDFHFYRVELVRVRYIGGFGRIHWLDPDGLCLANPFSEAVESRMIEHMNVDHANAMRDYCRLFGVEAAEPPRLSAIDAEGFDVMAGKKLLRIDFEAPVSRPDAVRAALVALARRAAPVSGGSHGGT